MASSFSGCCGASHRPFPRPRGQAKCSFGDIKSDAWKAAKKLPFFPVLKREEQYGLRGVTMNCETVEFEDNMPVRTANLYQNVLKVRLRRPAPPYLRAP